jgi:thiamine monophosphate synthase
VTATVSLGRLLVLTDRSQLPLGRGLVATLTACREAGLESVIVREQDLTASCRGALIGALGDLGLTVISSRTPDPAADGIHLAADQSTPEHGRFGRSCHAPHDVAAAAAGGADWVTLSPYAATASKPGYGPALPRTAFEGAVDVPVYALGGIDVDNAGQARAAGAHGVAVMGAVMRAADPGRVVAELLAALR